jgi:hypothetical protein
VTLFIEISESSRQRQMCSAPALLADIQKRLSAIPHRFELDR